jgi:hypothetical protein
MEKEIEKRVEAAAERDGLTEAEKEELKEELKQALTEEPNGAVAQELTGKLVETLKEAVGKGTGEGAGITIEQVIPDSANPDAPVIVPELPPIDVAPEPAAPVTPPVNTPPVTPPYTPPPVLDTTAPVLSGGRFGALDTFGGDTADIAFNTDEAGTYYYVALDSSGLTPVPTEAEIRAASSGSSGSPGSPGSPGSSTVSGSAKVQAGTAIVTISGLTVNTPYIVYLIVVDARGNTSEILTIGPFTPTYTQAGQLAADLGGKNKEGDNVNTVILMDDNTITSGTVMIPDGITLDTGTYILTLNNSATLSVAGTLSIKGTFNMAGTLSVDTTGVINVEQNGTIIYTQDRTGGGEFKGIINVKSGGTSMDLENSSAALWSNATGRTVHYAGSKTYSGGNTPNHLLIGTAEDPTTTRIALTSGTFSSGYTLDGKATLNRTFGLDGRTLTIKTGGKITIHTRIEENSGVYGGLWVVGPTSAILGEEGASIEIETPEGGVQGGKIYFSSGGVSNFYDSSENQIKIPSGSNFEIGVGVYDWNDDLQGWKQQ